MTITQRIKRCDNGDVATWTNKKDDKKLEVHKSIFWTRRYPKYLTMYYTHDVLVAGSNGLSLKTAVKEVQCWLNRGGSE